MKDLHGLPITRALIAGLLPENQAIENQAIENQAIENLVIENLVIEILVIENLVIENLVIENLVIENQAIAEVLIEMVQDLQEAALVAREMIYAMKTEE